MQPPQSAPEIKAGLETTEKGGVDVYKRQENGIDYILIGDYYIPDLKLPEEHRPIGKYGRCLLYTSIPSSNRTCSTACGQLTET